MFWTFLQDCSNTWTFLSPAVIHTGGTEVPVLLYPHAPLFLPSGSGQLHAAFMPFQYGGGGGELNDVSKEK